MNEEEVKEKIGEENWDEFCNYMRGQTVGMGKDGKTDYYNQDVEKYLWLKETGRLVKWWENKK